jgi:hypothetical protein
MLRRIDRGIDAVEASASALVWDRTEADAVVKDR